MSITRLRRRNRLADYLIVTLIVDIHSANESKLYRRRDGFTPFSSDLPDILHMSVMLYSRRNQHYFPTARIRPLYTLACKPRRNEMEDISRLVRSFNESKEKVREKRKHKKTLAHMLVPMHHRESERRLRALKRDSCLGDGLPLPNRPAIPLQPPNRRKPI